MVEKEISPRPIQDTEPTEPTALPSMPARCPVKLQKLKLLPSRAPTEMDKSEEATLPQGLSTGLSTPMQEIRLSILEASESNRESERDRAENDAERQSQPGEPIPQYLEGWRLHILTLSIWVSLFLSTLETTIVSTSLVSIANALDGFNLRDWIITAYLITYTGFLIIYAKFSDVFGRKTMFLLALFIFTLFSILCGAATGILELIIFRAFQGMGASGIYSMVMVIAPTLVPNEKYGKYIAIISTVFIVASAVGPILGGAINTNSSWRWVFLLNAPAGALAITLVAIFLPSSTPVRGGHNFLTHVRSKLRRSVFARIDILGAFLLLAFSVLFVFALEEAGNRFPWSSPAIIVTLVFGSLAGILFVGWEWHVERSSSRQEAVFPLSLLKDRIFAGMMATAFFIGFPFVAIIVNIPQRAQAVYGDSPLTAGLALLPLLLCSPLATAVSGYLTSNLKIPPVYLILIGAFLQVIGVGLTCSLPTNNFVKIPPQQYGYEAIMGIGFGLGLSTLLTLARLVVDERNLSVTMGALTQVRVLGGTISLAVCSMILNNHLRPSLGPSITPEQSQAISDSLSAIELLTPSQQAVVRQAFAEGYNKQNIFLTALTGIGLITSLFIWERIPRRVK